MTTSQTRRDASRAYLILVAAFAAFAAATTTVEVNFANFLRESYDVGEWFRGFLEFPRESQGFAMVFYVVLLGTLTERRLFSLAAVVAAVGVAGLALLPARALADGIAGIVPGLPLILFVMCYSAGQHMGMLIERAIVVDHGDLASAGRRLGRIGFWKTLAGLVMAGIVWGLRAVTELDFAFYFALAAGLFLASMALTRLAMRGQPEVRLRRRTLILKRKFLRYYALCALFGVRKQVFITFAVWVLVVIYEQPVQTIAVLWVATAVTNLIAQPLIGSLLDRYGPRAVLSVDAVLLCGVCLMYGYGAQLFPPAIGLIVIGATYVVDHVLFFVGAARAVYVGRLCADRDELSTTLSMGVTIDHVFSMTVPFVGGIIWKTSGYEMVFLLGGLIAVVTAVTAFGIYTRRTGARGDACGPIALLVPVGDAAFGGGDVGGAVEHGYLQVEFACGARFQVLQEAVPAVPGAPEGRAVARLHAGHVAGGGEVLPLGEQRQLGSRHAPLQAVCQPVVDQRDGYGAVGVRYRPVHVHIVAGARFRGARPLVDRGIDRAIVQPLGAEAAVDQKPGTLVEQREAGIGVVQQHQRRAQPAEVLHPVVDADAAFAQGGGDFAAQLQGGAECHRLAHGAGDAQPVVVPLPATAGAHLARRYGGQPPVQAQFLAFLVRVGLGMADEGQAATDQQAAEETAHPAVTGGLEKRRSDVAGGAAKTQ